MLVVLGATASGKSALAVALALRFDGEVINADSRQVCRGLDIGTGKPTLAERRGVPHHLFDVVRPGETFSAARFRERALAIARDVAARGRLPIVAGGTGLYLRVLERGLFPGPSRDERVHGRLDAIAARGGLGRLYRWLDRVDPDWARRVGPGDRQRILRGLDVYLQSGLPITEHLRRQPPAESPFDVLRIGIDWPRAELYRRIDARVDAMVAGGLMAEVARLAAEPGFAGSGAATALGYRELAGALAGRLTLAEAVERTKRDTRRLAKRQLTWFRREPDVCWIPALDGAGPEAAAARLVQDRFFGGPDQAGLAGDSRIRRQEREREATP